MIYFESKWIFHNSDAYASSFNKTETAPSIKFWWWSFPTIFVWIGYRDLLKWTTTNFKADFRIRFHAKFSVNKNRNLYLSSEETCKNEKKNASHTIILVLLKILDSTFSQFNFWFVSPPVSTPQKLLFSPQFLSSKTIKLKGYRSRRNILTCSLVRNVKCQIDKWYR